MTAVLGEVLLGPPQTAAPPAWTIERADDRDETAYRRLRRAVFVAEQGLFTATDTDDTDDDPRRVVLVARDHHGQLLGGVRLAPVCEPDLGWWRGSRLVVEPGARRAGGIGAALVRSACAHAEALGVLRFEARVQTANEPLFRHLGWDAIEATTVADHPHVLMRWPIDRIATQARASKAMLGPLLAGLRSAGVGSTNYALGGTGFIGDDGAPVPGTDLIAACDAIVPAMVERDPEWAGWCSVLVNVNDLSAMGARPVGVLDALAARDASFAARVLAGLRAAAEAYGVPVLGGHTQLGVPAALSVTALGRTETPIPASGGRVGQPVRVTADLGGTWRAGYAGRQWDSTSHRRANELADQIDFVRTSEPAAAKDVSMAGLVGTLGMLAEASGTGAELDVAAIPRPRAATMGDWLTCFPGFAMLTTDTEGRVVDAPATTESTVCGVLTEDSGVRLRWPDGVTTAALTDPVTGLGPSITVQT